MLRKRATPDPGRRVVGETHSPRLLLPVLVVLIVVGFGSFAASVVSARTSGAASSSQVNRNADLINQVHGLADQIRQLQLEQQKDTAAFRARVRQVDAAICTALQGLATAAGVTPVTCPTLPDPNNPAP